MRLIFIITLILILSDSVLSQNKLRRLTFEIADTTLSEIEQAKSIYNWIITNIAYDTKQLHKPPKEYTPSQTIKRKKAICYGYSVLFYRMCSILDIEAYVINGYSKGFDYTKCEHFLKSDHSWNIIYADSIWVIIDATWGSGFLKYTYDFKTKIKRVFNKNAGIKTAVHFTEYPSDMYFNISPKEVIETHYPMDSKWQLINYPITYKTFVSDTFENSPYINYEKEISFVRDKGLDFLFFIDALNSLKYNQFNKFDIANQYFHQANNINIDKNTLIDTSLLPKIEKSLNYYDSSYKYINEFKTLNHNYYKSKKLNHKSIYKTSSRNLKLIRKVPTSFNNKYEREFNKLLRTESDLEKYYLSTFKSIYSMPTDITYDYDTLKTLDTLQYNENILKVKIDSSKYISTYGHTSQLKQDLDSIYSTGNSHNDSIITILKKLDTYLQLILFSIDQMDTYEVLLNCKELSSKYIKYDYYYNQKEHIQNRLVYNYNLLLRESEDCERRLIALFKSYNKLAKQTGENLKYSNMSEDIIEKLRNLYNLRLSTISIIKLHNDTWKELLSNQNEILSKYGSKGLSDLNYRLTLFYNYITEKDNKIFQGNMELYNEIKDGIKKNKTQLKSIIREI